MAKRTFLISAVAILAGAAALRTLWLTADPPTTNAGIVWHDEGAWTHNARNKALWDVWVTDQWNPVYVAPVFIAFEYGAFREFGVGTWQARTVPAVSGLAAVAFLMIGLAAVADRRSALMGGVLLAADYVFVSWNRAALMESTMTAFIVVSWAAYALADRRPWWGLVAGGAAIGAFFTKASAAFFVAAIGLDVAVTIAASRFSRIRRWTGLSSPPPDAVRGAGWTLAGVAVAGAPIAALFLLPHWHDYVAYNVVMPLERKPSYGWHDLMTRASLLPLSQSFYTQIWPITAAAALGVAGIIARWRQARSGARLLVLWLLLGFAELIIHDSTNGRRHVMLLPALVALGACWLGSADNLLPARLTTKRPGLVTLLLAPIVLYLAYVVFASLIQWPLAADVAASRYSHAVWISTGLAVACGAAILGRESAIRAWLANRRVPAAAGALVVAAVASWNLVEYAQWARGRTYVNYRASVALGRLLAPGTLVQGILANGLSLENRIRPLFIGNDFGNYADRFQRSDARYILTDILPREGYESGDQNRHLISQILDRYPAAGPPGDRHPIATFDILDIDRLERAALFDKFPR